MLSTNYSGTKYPKCENTVFELGEDTPLSRHSDGLDQWIPYLWSLTVGMT